MTSHRPLPAASDAWALFLDVDGTLIDLALTPVDVHVSPELPSLLTQLSHHFGGALALVSGRCIADLDTLFHPLRLPAAGIHGVERRDRVGKFHYSGFTPENLAPARDELSRFVADHPGLLLEDKGRGLALHYRLAPHLAEEALHAARRALERLNVEAHIQHGHAVYELKSLRANKRTAIEQFMQEPPFAGRVPVFIGDDVTDRDGFEFVEATGGHAVFVGPAPDPDRGWLPHPLAVREWLTSVAAPSLTEKTY